MCPKTSWCRSLCNMVKTGTIESSSWISKLRYEQLQKLIDTENTI
jgi:hypothetical protein